MARTYCFNCGREVRAADTGQLPICEVCRVQQAGGLARYLVRPAGGRSQGPLTREQVVEQLRKELLAGEDRLAEEGGEWKQLDQHADFVGYFIPGDPLYDALHEERDEQVRRTSSWRRRAGARVVGKVLLVAALVGIPVTIVQLDIELIPPSVMEALKGGTQETLEEMGRTFSKAVDEEEAERQLQEERGLPGEALVEAFREQWPEASSPIDQRLALARLGMLQGTHAGLENARRELEYAVAAEDQNVEALGALAVVYFHLHDSDNQLQAHALDLYGRAQTIDPQHTAVLRAQAGMAVVSGSWEEAEEMGRSCLEQLPDDGICNWYLGQALAQAGSFEEAQTLLQKAKEQTEDAPVIDLALGRAALETHHHSQAIGPLTAFAERYPADPGIHELLARYHRDLGHWDEAIAAGRRAIELDGESFQGHWIAGGLLLHAKGDPKGAWELLDGLHENPSLESYEQRAEVMLQGCLAVTAVGDAERATATCTELTDHRAGWAPAQLAEAWAWHLAGDDLKAEEALKLADSTSIEGWELGRYHLEAGRFYDAVGRERLALIEYQSAVEETRDYGDARFVDAAALLRISNIRESLTLIESTWTMDWSVDAGRDPVVRIPREPVDFAAIARLVRGEIPAGSPVGERLPAILGILEAQVCLRLGAGCTRAWGNLKAALAANPENVAAEAYLGHLAMQGGRWSEATDHYAAVLRLESATPVVQSLNGLAHALNGNAVEAISLLDVVSNYGDGVPGVQRRHARALMAVGMRDEAVEMALQALTADDSDYESKVLLVELRQE